METTIAAKDDGSYPVSEGVCVNGPWLGPGNLISRVQCHVAFIGAAILKGKENREKQKRRRFILMRVFFTDNAFYAFLVAQETICT